MATEALPEGEVALTRGEREVVRWVGCGLPDKEIAQPLGVSVTTLCSHHSSVYPKLGHGSRVGLALCAAQTLGSVMGDGQASHTGSQIEPGDIRSLLERRRS